MLQEFVLNPSSRIGTIFIFLINRNLSFGRISLIEKIIWQIKINDNESYFKITSKIIPILKSKILTEFSIWVYFRLKSDKTVMSNELNIKNWNKLLRLILFETFKETLFIISTFRYNSNLHKTFMIIIKTIIPSCIPKFFINKLDAIP